MKSDNRKFLGIVLIVLGGIVLLNRLGLWNIDIFFDGWWTLLLIIPALYLMTKNGVSTGNVVLLLIGIFFLLDEIGFSLRGYLLPVVLVTIGIAVLFRKK
ncbi:MAG: hypothetical protein CVV56_04560 [Tenericutes bacterium HGW-Tenericutes-1]|jgi:predicted membrane protein|nr:MAG: hypothetical protein CVV56_04560 [Tenericutes bacterium HGW-Tenericutes-1]